MKNGDRQVAFFWANPVLYGRAQLSISGSNLFHAFENHEFQFEHVAASDPKRTSANTLNSYGLEADSARRDKSTHWRWAREVPRAAGWQLIEASHRR